MRSQRGLGLKIVLIQKDTESNKLIRKRWLYNGIWFSPNRVGKKKKSLPTVHNMIPVISKIRLRSRSSLTFFRFFFNRLGCSFNCTDHVNFQKIMKTKMFNLQFDGSFAHSMFASTKVAFSFSEDARQKQDSKDPNWLDIHCRLQRLRQ